MGEEAWFCDKVRLVILVNGYRGFGQRPFHVAGEAPLVMPRNKSNIKLALSREWVPARLRSNFLCSLLGRYRQALYGYDPRFFHKDSGKSKIACIP